ncbi:MAG TPA: M23 family metallopeptidase [Anaerolineae bacterium]|nr:M23 family metallopeptidase [Anaerolineae bacterium]
MLTGMVPRAAKLPCVTRLVLLFSSVIALVAPPIQAQGEQPVYGLLSDMRLPWAHGDAEPRMLTQDWWEGHTADGLAWDFGRSGAPTPSPVAGTDVLAPTAGYVTAVRQQDPGYGNYVDIQGEQDWAVRLAHLQHQSGVRSEFSDVWIPRGVPIGQLGNTGSSDHPYHIHLELLWQGGRPPATGDDYPDDYLPADSYPFGVPRSSLERPAEDRETASNQDRYRPTLDVSWPLRGCAVVKGRTSYLSFFTVEPSKLHQYRWRVARLTDQTIVAQSDWHEDPVSGDSLQSLERGEYEWWAQARFPDIRYGHEDQWFEGDPRTERFRVLDLGNPFDWPAYLYYRFLTRCVMAAPRAVPDNPPSPMSPPSVEPEQLSSPVGCDQRVDLGDEQDEAAHRLEGWSGLWRNQPISPSGDTTFRYQPIRGQASLQLCVPQPGFDYVLTAEVQDYGCTDNFQIYVNGQGPIYSFTGSQSNTIIVHSVPISAAYVRSTAVEVTFKNTATDSCGAAAVYNVALAATPQRDQAQRPAVPATERIAFMSWSEGNREIHVVTAGTAFFLKKAI